MADHRRDRHWSIRRLAQWHGPANGSPAVPRPHGFDASTFLPIAHDDLVQGSLYILQLKLISIGLFEGWDDDMCCFSLLRTEAATMRWSRARYLAYDFDAYDAFDPAGNPPVYFWARYLKTHIPHNWFLLFEEARQRQRLWHATMEQFRQQRSTHLDENAEELDNDMILLAQTRTTTPPPSQPYALQETLSSISTLPLEAPTLGSECPSPISSHSPRTDQQTLLIDQQLASLTFSDERHGHAAIQEQPTTASELRSSIHKYSTTRSADATSSPQAASPSSLPQHRRSMSVRSLKKLRSSLNGIF
ncbi:hypothetical protein DM01DRAFT_1384621 [Hesseltinella vesiculosa]|uniref:Uncharacterized protein n=1 Tax=Hesseltinella vesiculosa TaxID=101127 RepID=A0A1X2GCS6_9FUNG|nr:hypothetical protein DM01DRAFT_1384621 [Hesseltinella vesiculosa]